VLAESTQQVACTDHTYLGIPRDARRTSRPARNATRQDAVADVFLTAWRRLDDVPEGGEIEANPLSTSSTLPIPDTLWPAEK
jgi:hypothetical protein